MKRWMTRNQTAGTSEEVGPAFGFVGFISIELMIDEISFYFIFFAEAGDSKTEHWTWALYLDETKAVAAPNKLFQEVH